MSVSQTLHTAEPARHPDDDEWIALVTGELPLLRRLVLEVHASLCARCSARMTELARPGARWLDAVGEAIDRRSDAPSDAAFEALLARLDEPNEPDETKESGVSDPAVDPAVDLPASGPVPTFLWAELDRAARRAPWNPLGPSSTELARIGRDPDRSLDLYLVRTPAGDVLPEHGHLGRETLVVLTGSFRDHTGRVGPGDFQASEVGVRHAPTMGAEGPCWALVCVGVGLDFGGPAS